MRKPKSNLLNQLFSSLNKEVKIHRTNSPNYDRRKFLTQSVKAAAGVAIAYNFPSYLTSCKSGNPSDTKDENLLDIAILGGGMSGLNCANHLLGSGLDFKIFEADRRVGGRILTHYNDSMGLGIFPEFGGDFIDSDHQDMLDLAKEFNLELLDMIAEQEANDWVKDIYYFDNRKISEEEIIQEFMKIAPKIAEDVDSLGENYDTPHAEILDNTPLSVYIQSLNCANWLKDLFVAAWVAEYGLDCEELSTINMLDMIDTSTEEGFKVFGSSDERYRIKGGNSEIIKGLAAKVGKDKIHNGYEVKSIVEQEDGSYLISFNNDEAIKSKAIVCTLPFTILRNLKLDLKSISAEKRKCIDELGYGKNTKLVLGYDSQPWRNKENNAMGYLFTNNMTNGWDGSVNKTENNTNGAYVAYFGGEYSQKLCNDSTQSPLAPATHVWRTELPKEKVLGYVEELDKIFINSKAHFTGHHVFVNWIDYPYVKASYSCYKVGQWSSIAGLEMEPVGNFFFAGEHCSELFQGFMNGAAETGRRVAEMLVEAKSI
ncbi:MAG: FAD-dependent oxidoreductase [Weeksellaceae bacterium]